MDHLVFDSSGQLTSQTNSAYQPRITYQGMWLDPASDLYYDKARWYNAVDSVFISPDPLGFAGGQTNLSEFVRNSPTNRTDPSGLQAIGGVTGLPPGDAADGFQRDVGVLSNASGGGDTPVFGSGYKALAISDILGGQTGHGPIWSNQFPGVPGVITGIQPPPSLAPPIVLPNMTVAQLHQLVANAIAAILPPPQPITSIQLDQVSITEIPQTTTGLANGGLNPGALPYCPLYHPSPKNPPIEPIQVVPYGTLILSNSSGVAPGSEYNSEILGPLLQNTK